MVFRRRSKGAPTDDTEQTATEQTEAEQDAADDGGAISAAAEVEPNSGPWDVDDVPNDDVQRLDLGGLQIPTLPDIEIRLETDPAGAVNGVLLVSGPSAVRIGAFAAPRRAGIWADVRAEMLESLIADGGRGEERDGPFGPEILATVPAEKGSQTARFVGVDGPRWLVRAVFTGPAATNPAQAAALENALREVVVARGGDALPVRDPLPLVLPQEILDHAHGAEPDAPQAPGAPRRGPEITEIG